MSSAATTANEPNTASAAPTATPPMKVKPPRKKPAKTGEKKPKATSGAEGGESPQQQKQRDKEFAAHKIHIQENLQRNACDLSPKGSVDVKCLPVMEVLNTHDDYITTSSCSGRIALFHGIEPADGLVSSNTNEDTASGDLNPSPAPKARMKRGDDAALGWVFVKHGMLRPQEMIQVVHFLCGTPTTPEEVALDAAQVTAHTALMAAIVDREAQSAAAAPSPSASASSAGMFDGEMEGILVTAASTDRPLLLPTRGTVSLKMEPFVMHVECRTMEAAKRLLSAAVSDSGYRNSGVIPPGRKIMCGIRSTFGLGLDVPVVVRGVNYVAQQRAYVWALLGLANAKMEANENKIKLLEKSVAARLVGKK
jgi:tRNA wybutosine-synthesizing protein 3